MKEKKIIKQYNSPDKTLYVSIFLITFAANLVFGYSENKRDCERP